jgi:hypothetical protein
VFQRNAPPSSSGLWILEFTDKPEDEGGKFIWNYGFKLPNHTAQQPGRPTSATKSGDISNDCFVMLRISFFMIIYSSSFTMFCWCTIDFPWKNETMEGFIIFGRNLHECMTILLYKTERNG